MRKLIIVSIAMNTLLLAGVVALAIQAGSIPKGDTGASATEEQLIKAADKVKPTAEKLAEKVAPYVNDAKGFAENSSKSATDAKLAQAATTAVKEETKNIKTEVVVSATSAEKAAADAQTAKTAAEKAAKKAEEALVAASKIEKDAKAEMLKIKDDLIVPNKSVEHKISTVTGEFEPKKGTIEIKLTSVEPTNKLTTYYSKASKLSTNRTKVILLDHDEYAKRCIGKCGIATFQTDKANPYAIKIIVPVTFFDEIDKITGSTSLIVMFSTTEGKDWTHAPIKITKKP